MSRFAIFLIAAVLAICGPRVAIAGDDDALHLADMRALAVREAAAGRPGAAEFLALLGGSPDTPDRRAARWVVDAAQRNIPEAQHHVALNAQNQPRPDLRFVLEWYTKAANNGYAPSQRHLAALYEQGTGVARDAAKAAEWRAKADAGDKVRDARMMIDAADAGHVAAQAIVGTDYVKARDYPNALRYLGPAAEKGHPKAQANLALMYLHGNGVDKDVAAAARWFRLSADQGDPVAQSNLGAMYLDGLGGLPRNDAEAVRLFKLAAAKGNAKAQAGLGLMYEQGRGGLKPDRSMALDLYRRAAAGGERFAIDRQKKLEGGAAK